MFTPFGMTTTFSSGHPSSRCTCSRTASATAVTRWARRLVSRHAQRSRARGYTSMLRLLTITTGTPASRPASVPNQLAWNR